MISHDLRSFDAEPQQVIDYEFVKWFQKKRRSAQWCPVQLLALLMAYRLFYDLYAELRRLGIKIILVAVKVSEKSVYCLPKFNTCNLAPIPYMLCIVQHNFPVFRFSCQAPRVPLQVLRSSHLSVCLLLLSYMLMASILIPSSTSVLFCSFHHMY